MCCVICDVFWTQSVEKFEVFTVTDELFNHSKLISLAPKSVVLVPPGKTVIGDNSLGQESSRFFPQFIAMFDICIYKLRVHLSANKCYIRCYSLASIREESHHAIAHVNETEIDISTQYVLYKLCGQTSWLPLPNWRCSFRCKTLNMFCSIQFSLGYNFIVVETEEKTVFFITVQPE